MSTFSDKLIDAHRLDAVHTLILGALAGLATKDSAEQEPSPAAATSLAVRWAALTGLASAQLTAVLVGLTTLLGENEASAQLDGYGPLPAWMARAMARYRELRRFLTDPLTGELVHLDPHAYPPGYLNGIRPEDPDPPDDPADGDASGPGGGDPPSAGPTPPAPNSDQCVPWTPRTAPSARSAGPAPTPHRRRWRRSSGGAGGTAPHPGAVVGPQPATSTTRSPGRPGRPARATSRPCAERTTPAHNSPHDGGGPAAAYAARSGTLPWTWQVHRCTHGHQHWTDPLRAEHIAAPPPPLGTPVSDNQKPHLTSPLTPLAYPRPAHALPPLAPTTPPPPSPYDGGPTLLNHRL